MPIISDVFFILYTIKPCYIGYLL